MGFKAGLKGKTYYQLNDDLTERDDLPVREFVLNTGGMFRLYFEEHLVSETLEIVIRNSGACGGREFLLAYDLQKCVVYLYDGKVKRFDEMFDSLKYPEQLKFGMDEYLDWEKTYTSFLARMKEYSREE